MSRHLFFKYVLSASLAVILAASAHPAQAKEVYTGLFGLWAWGDSSSGMQLLKDNRFQIAAGVNSDADLNNAQRMGIKCLVGFNPNLSKAIVEDEVQWQQFLVTVKRRVAELKNHPAVFGWYVVDEPDWMELPVAKLKVLRDAVKSVDKSKPMFTVLGNRNKWDRYLPYFDIIAIDPYLSIASDGTVDSPEKVKTYIQKVRTDLQKLKLRKPVWVVLGAFQEKPRTAAIKSHFVKPTPAQFNSMADIALGQGVDGILAFTLAFKYKPDFLDWNLTQEDPLLWDAVRNLPNRVTQH
jgi:hypothetical protein